MSSTLPPVILGTEIVPLEKRPRKRGAPRGNRNALKHGIYSHTFSRKEIQRLDKNVEGEFHDEEEYLRILIARVAEFSKKQSH